jgi:hypothetical protein
VTVAPITSTIRGVPSEVVPGIDDGVKIRFAVNLHRDRHGPTGAGRPPMNADERRFWVHPVE